MLLGVTFVVFHCPVAGSSCVSGRTVTTTNCSAKTPAGTAPLRRELHYVQPPTIIKAIQLSPSYTVFHPYVPCNMREARVLRTLRHAALPIGFPFLDKSGDDRLRFFTAWYFTYYMLTADFQ